MPFILILLFIFTSAALAQENVSRCELGGYNYSGTYYDDSYSLPAVKGEEACLNRHGTDAPKLGEIYRANNKELEVEVAKVIARAKCPGIVEILEQYQASLINLKSIFDQNAAARVELFKLVVEKIDIQRTYAYAAVFNSTCSGDEHRKYAMNDLDYLNKLATYGNLAPTEVKENGQNVDNCAFVNASGMANLDGFTVSMKKASGSEFLFNYDVYSIPDRVVVRNSAGSTLFDSGCNPTEEVISKKIPLSSLGSDKKAIVSVVNNCQKIMTSGKSVSAWELNIRCQQEKPINCQDDITHLLSLMQKQVELIKKLIDIHGKERECYVHYDQNILSELIKGKLIAPDRNIFAGGFCHSLDMICLSLQKQKRFDELQSFNEANTQVVAPISRPDFGNLRIPSSDVAPKSMSDAHCAKPTEADSVLKYVSRAYCKTGYKRLGIEPQEE